jgi:hypothetical protein
MNQGLGWLAQKNSKSQRFNEINNLEIYLAQQQKLVGRWLGKIPYHGLCV